MVDLSKMKEVLLDWSCNDDSQGARWRYKWIDVYDMFRGGDVDLMIVGQWSVPHCRCRCMATLLAVDSAHSIQSQFWSSLLPRARYSIWQTAKRTDSLIAQESLLGSSGWRWWQFWYCRVTEFTFRVNKLRGKKLVIGHLTWPVCERDGAEAFASAMTVFIQFHEYTWRAELCMDAFWSFKDGDNTKSQAQMMTIIYNGTIRWTNAQSFSALPCPCFWTR